MRDYIDAILDAIDAASLNDEEFDTFTIEVETLTAPLYQEILRVLDDRETMSLTRDRLTAYFKAYGVQVTEPPAAKSQIYLGDAL